MQDNLCGRIAARAMPTREDNTIWVFIAIFSFASMSYLWPIFLPFVLAFVCLLVRVSCERADEDVVAASRLLNNECLRRDDTTMIARAMIRVRFGIELYVLDTQFPNISCDALSFYNELLASGDVIDPIRNKLPRRRWGLLPMVDLTHDVWLTTYDDRIQRVARELEHLCV